MGRMFAVSVFPLALFPALAALIGCSPNQHAGPPAKDVGGALADSSSTDVGPISHPDARVTPDTESADVATTTPCAPPNIDWHFDGRTFDVPDAPPMWSDQMTKAELAGVGQTGPNAASLVTGSATPFTASGGTERLWLRAGEPLRLSFALLTDPAILDGHRAYFALVADYEVPDGIQWTRWLEERGGPTETSTAGGVAFDVASGIELVDVQIPASYFAEARTYEVGLFVKFGRTDRSNAHFINRIHLFHDGYDWPTLKCFELPIDGYYKEDERELALGPVGGPHKGLAVPTGVTDADQLTAPSIRRPVEVVTVDVVMQNTGFEREGPVPMAVFAFLEGAPVSEVWPFFIAETDRVTAGGRRQFAFALPDTPGRYDFFVGGWWYAQEPAIAPEGTPFADTRGRGGGTTNTIRFIVE